jgi:hypothetical protein
LRVVADRLPTSKPAKRLKRTSRIGDVVVAYLREQADAVVWGDPAARQDVPGAVHAMRVATRRMRSALQAYGPVIDRAATRELSGELKWLAPSSVSASCPCATAANRPGVAAQRPGRHKPQVTQRDGQQPAQRAENGAVEPRHPRTRVASAQHGDLVT